MQSMKNATHQLKAAEADKSSAAALRPSEICGGAHELFSVTRPGQLSALGLHSSLVPQRITTGTLLLDPAGGLKFLRPPLYIHPLFQFLNTPLITTKRYGSLHIPLS